MNEVPMSRTPAGLTPARTPGAASRARPAAGVCACAIRGKDPNTPACGIAQGCTGAGWHIFGAYCPRAAPAGRPGTLGWPPLPTATAKLLNRPLSPSRGTAAAVHRTIPSIQGSSRANRTPISDGSEGCCTTPSVVAAMRLAFTAFPRYKSVGQFPSILARYSLFWLE